jgi:hypothetical protein
MKVCLNLLLAAAFLIFPIISQAQTSRVLGKVLQEGGEQPLEFANVSLLSAKDSSFVTGTFSDTDGTFELEARPGELT